MEMLNEMKKYEAKLIPVYQSSRRDERLRWKSVMKEICLKSIKKLWSRERKRISVTSMGFNFNVKTIPKSRSCMTEICKDAKQHVNYKT